MYIYLFMLLSRPFNFIIQEGKININGGVIAFGVPKTLKFEGVSATVDLIKCAWILKIRNG